MHPHYHPHRATAQPANAGSFLALQTSWGGVTHSFLVAYAALYAAIRALFSALLYAPIYRNGFATVCGFFVCKPLGNCVRRYLLPCPSPRRSFQALPATLPEPSAGLSGVTCYPARALGGAFRCYLLPSTALGGTFRRYPRHCGALFGKCRLYFIVISLQFIYYSHFKTINFYG
jgi:hypothetical protein